MASSSALTIGLLWHSIKSDNLGVGALTQSHLAILDGIAGSLNVPLHYMVIGWRDPQPGYIAHPRLTAFEMRGRDLIKPSGLYSAVRGCDLILDISAGDSFTDIYGVRRFIFNALGKAVVLMAKKPLILAPQTIGPFQRPWTRFIAGLIMRRATKIVTRDNLTTDFLKSFNLKRDVLEATDVAFRLPYEVRRAPDREKVRVGINVSGLLFNGGYSQDDMFRLAADYPSLVRMLLDAFHNKPGCEVHLIGHVNSEHISVEDDYRVCETLAGEFPGAVVAPRFRSPSDAKSYISGLDFFCGSRMHACIAAFSAGVPVLPIAYSRKFAGVFGSLDYSRWADCRTQSASEIAGIALKAFDERETLKAELERGLHKADKKLDRYVDYLRTALAKTANL